MREIIIGHVEFTLIFLFDDFLFKIAILEPLKVRFLDKKQKVSVRRRYSGGWCWLQAAVVKPFAQRLLVVNVFYLFLYRKRGAKNYSYASYDQEAFKSLF